jgi:hypothetical protein
MVERISTQADFETYKAERLVARRLREAITFCKTSLELPFVTDMKLKAPERVSFERCLVDNYLLKHGNDYFGKRDLIYLDLYGVDDIASMQQSV